MLQCLTHAAFTSPPSVKERVSIKRHRKINVQSLNSSFYWIRRAVTWKRKLKTHIRMVYKSFSYHNLFPFSLDYLGSMESHFTQLFKVSVKADMNNKVHSRMPWALTNQRQMLLREFPVPDSLTGSWRETLGIPPPQLLPVIPEPNPRHSLVGNQYTNSKLCLFSILDFCNIAGLAKVTSSWLYFWEMAPASNEPFPYTPIPKQP